jgi:hypothetical protein
VTTIDETVRTFADLLASPQPVEAGEADRAVWAYLTPVQGLHAQVQALELLRARTDDLDTASTFMPVLINILGRHHARLSERPAGASEPGADATD